MGEIKYEARRAKTAEERLGKVEKGLKAGRARARFGEAESVWGSGFLVGFWNGFEVERAPEGHHFCIFAALGCFCEQLLTQLHSFGSSTSNYRGNQAHSGLWTHSHPYHW